MYIFPIFIHSSLGGKLGWFRNLAVMSSAKMNRERRGSSSVVPWLRCTLWCSDDGVEEWNYMVIILTAFEKPCIDFNDDLISLHSCQLCIRILSPSIHDSMCCSLNDYTLTGVSEMDLRVVLIWISPMTKDVECYFHWLFVLHHHRAVCWAPFVKDTVFSSMWVPSSLPLLREFGAGPSALFPLCICLSLCQQHTGFILWIWNVT